MKPLAILLAVVLIWLALCLIASVADAATDLGYVDHPEPGRATLAAEGGAKTYVSPMPPLDQLDLHYATSLRLGLQPVYRLNPCDDELWADGVDRRYPEAIFQIGNEPDLHPAPASSCGPRPRDVQRQLKLFWQVAEEPGVAPAMSGCRTRWLRAFDRLNINRWSRAIALNFYPGMNVPGLRAAARCAHRAHRIVGGPVWITELGFPLDHTKRTGRRAARAFRLLDRVRSVRLIAWYRLVDFNGAFRWDSRAGTLTAALDTKPAFWYLRREAR